MIFNLIISLLLINVNEDIEKENLVGNWERVCLENEALGFQVSHCNFFGDREMFINEWNYIDFAFLDDSTNEDIASYELCDLPKIIEYSYDFIINVAESEMPYQCSLTKPDQYDQCTETIFEYLDILGDV